MSCYNNSNRQVNIAEVREKAKGRWLELLPALGINLPFNKKVPCPTGCGSKIRFDDKHGLGKWICSTCGSGDGINLVMNIENCDARAAALIVQEALGGNISQLDVKYIPEVDYAEQYQLARKEALHDWFFNTSLVPDDHPYLLKKQIPALEALYLADSNEIVIPYISPEEGICSLQRLSLRGKYFTTGSGNKAAFLPIGEPTPDNRVIVCTGYSTGVSIHLATGLMVLCSVSDSTLASTIRFAIESGYIVCLAADNDHPTSKTHKVTKVNSGHNTAVKLIEKYKIDGKSPDEIHGVADFNDLHTHTTLGGLSAVRACFSSFIEEAR